jgi:hypothetical protein
LEAVQPLQRPEIEGQLISTRDRRRMRADFRDACRISARGHACLYERRN